MSVAYVNSGALTASISSGVLTPALPASRVNGNVLIAVFADGGGSSGFTLSGSGWTVGDSYNDFTNAASYMWAWRLVDGTEATPTGTCSNYGSVGAQAIIFQYSGVLTPSPIGHDGFDPIGSGSSVSASSVTTTAANSLVVAIGLYFVSTAGSISTGWTKDADPTTTVTTHGFGILAGSKTVGTSGTGSGSPTISFGSTAAKAVAWVIELKAQSINELTTIDMTFPAMQQEVDAMANPSAAISQTFFTLTQEVDVADSPSATIAQTFPLIAQSVSVVIGDDGSIVQTLPGMLQDVVVIVETEILGIAQIFPTLSQEIDVSLGGPARIAMTFLTMQQEIDVTELITSSIDMTFPTFEISQFDVFETPPLIIAQQFFPLAQEFDATLSLDTQIAMTFFPLYLIPDDCRIDMVFGGGGGGNDEGSFSRSWWYPAN